jgi:enediyne biosynthesis protein E4
MRRFEDVGRSAGDGFRRPMVARGAAYADYDADGDLDVLVTTNNGPARLLRNDGGNRNNWLRVVAIGGPSNRDAIGSKVQLFIDSKPGPWSIVKTGSSYCSQSELPLTFGLGRASRVSGLKITWPDGSVDNVAAIDANQTVTIQEGRGIIRRSRLPR